MFISRAFRGTLALCGLGFLAGCTVDNPAFDPPQAVCAADETYVRQPFTLVDPQQVDILFVVDNGAGMLEAQQQLAQSMPAFVSALTADAALDWRLGVVSMDVLNAPGTLLTGANNAGCPAATDPVITRSTPDSGLRASCAVRAGESGDNFEQGFQAARQALDPSRGFVREGAATVVVFFSNEDDCSSTASFSRADENNCRTQPATLVPVNDFAQFFLSRRTRSGDQLSVVSLVAGTGDGATAISCGSEAQAFAGNRYAQFVDIVGRNSFVDTICTESYDRVLNDVLARVIQTEDDVVCVDRRMVGGPSLVVLRPTQEAEATATLSEFGDYLSLGATVECPKGAVSVSRSAHTALTGHRVEVWFCTDEAVTP
jgi:hypothetical protein